MAPRSIRNYARMLPQLLRLARKPSEPFFVQRFDGLEVVHRDTFLIELSRGRNVLHFGFLDHPLSAEKLRSGGLLHARIARVAGSLYGIDVDADALALYRRETGDLSNSLLDVESDAPPGPELSRRFDLVLFPDILEHLRNPGLGLDKLRAVAAENSGCEVCVTVPNALAMRSFAAAVHGWEMVHPGHYTYFSPHTLRHLLEDSGFAVQQVLLASHDRRRRGVGLSHDTVAAICRVA